MGRVVGERRVAQALVMIQGVKGLRVRHVFEGQGRVVFVGREGCEGVEGLGVQQCEGVEGLGVQQCISGGGGR